MKKKIKKILRITLVVLVMVWVAMFITDFITTKLNTKPMFCLGHNTYDDGGSGEYYGLGYKVNVWCYLSAEEGLLVISEIGGYSMEFDVNEKDWEVEKKKRNIK